jgi:hypothetical protein
MTEYMLTSRRSGSEKFRLKIPQHHARHDFPLCCPFLDFRLPSFLDVEALFSYRLVALMHAALHTCMSVVMLAHIRLASHPHPQHSFTAGLLNA